MALAVPPSELPVTAARGRRRTFAKESRRTVKSGRRRDVRARVRRRTPSLAKCGFGERKWARRQVTVTDCLQKTKGRILGECFLVQYVGVPSTQILRKDCKLLMCILHRMHSVRGAVRRSIVIRALVALSTAFFLLCTISLSLVTVSERAYAHARHTHGRSHVATPSYKVSF